MPDFDVLEFLEMCVPLVSEHSIDDMRDLLNAGYSDADERLQMFVGIKAVVEAGQKAAEFFLVNGDRFDAKLAPGKSLVVYVFDWDRIHSDMRLSGIPDAICNEELSSRLSADNPFGAFKLSTATDHAVAGLRRFINSLPGVITAERGRTTRLALIFDAASLSASMATVNVLPVWLGSVPFCVSNGAHDD